MRKIPTLFERDWNGDRSRVIDKLNPACEWVAKGEGIPTQKIDGTCCLIRDGKLYKRREHGMRDRHHGRIPDDFEEIEQDPITGKAVGWVPVGDGPEDRWHREALDNLPHRNDGTYELIGPKIQGNPECYDQHALVWHASIFLDLGENVPRTFDGLKAWLAEKNIEGIVWHHLDGRMAKIKARDFGLKRRTPSATGSQS